MRNKRMTREEAKEAIKEAYGNSEYTEEIIKALEQEPFINKACVSTNVCKHDKEVALNNIKAEIKHHSALFINEFGEKSLAIYEDDVFEIIDKYAK